MSELFGDLPKVFTYFKDFLVCRETKEELDENLRKVLVRCSENNLKLQLKKCLFYCSKFSLLEHVLSEGQLKVDPFKVEAILKFLEPEDKKALTRLMGMVVTLDTFCEGLATHSRSLRDLP